MQQAQALKVPVAVAHATADPAVRPPPTREDALHALEQAGGNRAAASRALGIGRTTLWRLMKD
jgi:propionate catabolism operon transcriptional regulator